MKRVRKYSFISLLVFLIQPLYAAGFGINHSGFWSYTGAVLLCIVANVIAIGICFILSDELGIGIIRDDDWWFLIITVFFSVYSFWLFPTYWCSFLGILLSVIIIFSFLRYKGAFPYFVGIIVSFCFVLFLNILSEQPWNKYLYYFFAAILFVLVSRSLANINQKWKKISLIISLVLLSLYCFFIILLSKKTDNLTYWIVFGVIFILCIVKGWISKKANKNRNEIKYKKLFKKHRSEVFRIVKKIPSVAMESSWARGKIRIMSKNLRMALLYFEEGNEVKAVNSLESFFDDKPMHYKKDVKGKQNNILYSDFLKIAEKLSNEVGFDCSRFLKQENEKHNPENLDEQKKDDDEFDEIIDGIINSDDEDLESEERSGSDEEASIEVNFDDEDEMTKYINNVFSELDSLTGLTRVKEEIRSIVNLKLLDMKRENLGIEVSPISLHLVFSGNPGTGKTTVARLLAKIYRKMHILKKGQLIETDREGLVGEYIGDTAPKTKSKIREAMGGILFIDEAYTLCPEDSPRDYGKEAIDTLLKEMEDKRDAFMVIAAGYNDEMVRFVKSNPGLESRFTTVIHFDDYSGNELYEIFLGMCKKQKWIIPNELHDDLKTYFNDMYVNREDNFANAREVRNYLEASRKRQAIRLGSINSSKWTKKELQTLTREDLGL